MKLLIFSLFALIPQLALAHVKWFSDYNFQEAPLKLADLNHPTFWGLFALSIVSLPLLVWLDRKAEGSVTYNKVNTFLDRYSGDALLIMRIATGSVLLMSWLSDSIVAPEITSPNAVVTWIQFGLALLLLFKETTPLAGAGMIAFYFLAMSQNGLFHMLDYVVYPAIGLFLILAPQKSERVSNLSLPILYSGLGFSLCWVAFEKMFYPYWGLSVLAQAPALTMGLDHEFFLLACAFVEFTLGYLLIIALLHRPLAAVITIVFFITTTFFGKTEVVGHTLLHGALLVFIVRGPGYYYQAPIKLHKSQGMRMLFACVNFVLLFGLLAFPYAKMSQSMHTKALDKRLQTAHPAFEIPVNAPVPSVRIEANQDPNGGWNLRFLTQNFSWAPEHAGHPDMMGSGHGHLYINGKKVGRVYGEWVHVSLPKGKNSIKVTLNTNEHKDYYHNGKPIQDEINLVEEREAAASQHDHH